MDTIDISKLVKALAKEHVDGCTDNTCAIKRAFDAGLYLYAADGLTRATECPETIAAFAEFDADDSDIEDERVELLSLPHLRCDCGATVWTDDAYAICGNCRAKVVASLADADPFTLAYAETALWSSTDNADDSGGAPLDDNYDIDDIDPKCVAEMLDDCRQFQFAQRELLAKAYEGNYDDARAGHDFWLTRNGHGAGFWDSGLGVVGAKLTQASKPYGSVDLYVDDGKVKC